jgi:erythromycin esterase-like protein
MKKTLVLPLTFFLFVQSQAQSSIKEFVRTTAVTITAIHPDSSNYADLEVFGKAIGDARIVMLGEQDHGDAPTFLAKTRLIRYLHEKKGFNVLAFENDFFSLNRGWELLPKDSVSIVDFLRHNIYPIWINCDACFPLFYQYVPAGFRTTSPLQITGFDNQMGLNYSRWLGVQLDSVLRAWQLPCTTTPEYQQMISLIDSMGKWNFNKPYDTLFDQCAAYLQRIRLEALAKMDANNFWLLLIDNLLSENQLFRLLKKDPLQAVELRDLRMAANLAWLHKVKYPKEKIIVWAANGHVAKLQTDMPGNPRKRTSMGGAFTADPAVAAATYVLGFNSYEGTAGRVGSTPYKLPTPRRESFEHWIRPKGAYAFIDFKNYRRLYPANREQFYMAGLNHYYDDANWTGLYDGIFYIDQMYPCSK